LKQALYLQEQGDASEITPTDIHQEQIGDCGLLSVLGEIAIKDPAYIPDQLIRRDDDSAETVALYNGAGGGDIDFKTAEFSPVSFHIDNNFPPGSVNGGRHDSVVDGFKEIWPQVLEKAYAIDQGATP
jgi:hypothetical protein